LSALLRYRASQTLASQPSEQLNKLIIELSLVLLNLLFAIVMLAMIALENVILNVKEL
jgi:hypothetical protein